MTYTKPAARVYLATTSLTIVGRYTGSARAHRLDFRIDGRGGAYRVDVAKPLFPAWEAIDGGQGFATVAQAKAHIRAWLRAAEAQADLTPTLG